MKTEYVGVGMESVIGGVIVITISLRVESKKWADPAPDPPPQLTY